MELLRIGSILSLAVALSQAYVRPGYKPDKKEDATPMVAFLCGKPAMHFTPQGWVKDDKTDCLKTPNDILNYCKQMYPDMEITNFVEADHKETIENWCPFGRDRCRRHGAHTVRPFKCLVGPFQSDALLVPDHCVFDHIHQSEECKSFHEWNKTATDACKTKHNMNKQSFAILLPCAVNMFGGVEYVCCPSDNAKQPIKIDNMNKMEIDEKPGKTIYPSKVNSKPVIAGDKAEQKMMAEKFAKVEHFNKDWRDEDWSDESSSSEEEDEDDYWDEEDDDYNYEEEDENDWEDSWEDEEDKVRI